MDHLDEATVASLLDPVEVTETLERVFAELGRGEAASTLRVRAKAGGGMASAMAAVIPSMGVSGGKIYATTAGRFTFHVVLFDLDDGHLLCTLDGGALTKVRTPALCGVAIRHLAGPKARTAALLGTGVESVPHLEMLARELPLVDLRVWGRTRERAEDVVGHGLSGGIPVRLVETAEEAVVGADVVVTVTSANEPIFDPAAVGHSALVCAVGATKPERCELAPDLFAMAASVVADSVEGSQAECGDLIHAVAAGTFRWDALVELSAVVGGAAAVPRAGTHGPVIFETQGVAIQDVAGAAQVWARYGDRTGGRSS